MSCICKGPEAEGYSVENSRSGEAKVAGTERRRNSEAMEALWRLGFQLVLQARRGVLPGFEWGAEA